MADVDVVDEQQASTEADEPEPSPFRSYGPWFVAKWALIILFNGFVLGVHPPPDRQQVVVAPGVPDRGRRRRRPDVHVPRADSRQVADPGVAILVLFGVFPVVYTVYLSFTNYGTCGTCGLLTRSQAVDQIVDQSVAPIWRTARPTGRRCSRATTGCSSSCRTRRIRARRIQVGTIGRPRGGRSRRRSSTPARRSPSTTASPR